MRLVRLIMDGDSCPIDGTRVHWLDTTNQWEFYCPTCDRRYNDDGEPMPPIESPEWQAGECWSTRRPC